MPADNFGTCLCEAVKYELYGKPEKCSICHCDSCQQFSGSAFIANCWYKNENFKIVHGHDSIQTYNERGTNSGQVLTRSFCKVCGSSLFQQTADLREAGLVSVASGTMDDRSDAQPTLEVWCRNRRNWLKIEHSGKKLETQ
ncbi:Mss4-like protein [Aspergillus karnatakaensis]|uniref:GFA family protein n=1 Tax=Aspergillus karnatakaensis TaxID=1810916 RepID=UPI003CCDEB8D